MVASIVSYYEVLNDEVNFLVSQGGHEEIEEVSLRSMNLLKVMTFNELNECLERIYKVR